MRYIASALRLHALTQNNLGVACELDTIMAEAPRPFTSFHYLYFLYESRIIVSTESLQSQRQN